MADMSTEADLAQRGVCVVGSVNVDYTVVAPNLPGAGETVLGGDLVISQGGKGANQAAAAARQGAPTRFVAAVGNDAAGTAAVAALATDGVAVDHIVRSSSPTGAALIAVDHQGENQIVVGRGANEYLSVATVRDHTAAADGCAVVLAQLETDAGATRVLFEYARRAGAVTILNVAPAPTAPLDLTGWVDIVVANEVEIVQIAASLGPTETPSVDVAAAAHLVRTLPEGPRAVIVTLGAAGSLVVDAHGERRIETLAVQPVDTVGAGDCFCGTLAAWLADTPPGADPLAPSSLDIAVRAANAAGALATLTPGARSAPTRPEVAARL